MTLCTKKSHRPQRTNTTFFGQQSFRWLGPKIWVQIPDQLKTINSLAAFKNQVKKVNFDNCPCNLCKEYIQGVGYITESSPKIHYFSTFPPITHDS